MITRDGHYRTRLLLNSTHIPDVCVRIG